MAPKTAAHDAAKKKASKEKKILVVLIVFLVLALGYAYKTLGKLHSSTAPTPVASSSSAASSSSSTPPASTPAATTTSAPVDVPTAASSTPPASSSSGGNGADSLISAVTPALNQGELRTFTLFDTKDPFNSQGPPTSELPSGSGSSSSGSGSQSTPPPTQKGSGSGSGSGSGTGSGSGSGGPQAALPTSAVISVNGDEQSVTVGGLFPVTTDQASNGIFQLVSLTQTTAKIAISGGSYASGAPTLTLHVGQPVTLANTADGKRYTLELFPQGTVAPAPVSGTSGSPTSTPTSTTPGP